MWLMKGLGLGAVGTMLFTFIFWKGGHGAGGTLAFQHVEIGSVGLYWSWPIFFGLVVLISGILKMMD